MLVKYFTVALFSHGGREPVVSKLRDVGNWLLGHLGRLL